MSSPTTFRKRIMTWLLIFVALYVIYCGLLFFFQAKLMFSASLTGDASGQLPTAETERLAYVSDQGDGVAWFVPAPDAASDRPAPLVVFFHGNAELIDHQLGIIDFYHTLGCSVLLVEYRGYGDSAGTPSEEHIVFDTLAVLSNVLERDDVDADKLVLHGRSIGGGLATQVALKTEAKALIVESTFTSAADMAKRYGVPPFIVTSPLRNEDAFRQLDIPIQIMHGEHDEIIPVDHAHALNRAAQDGWLTLFDAGHNDLPNGDGIPIYRAVVRKILERAEILPATTY